MCVSLDSQGFYSAISIEAHGSPMFLSMRRKDNSFLYSWFACLTCFINHQTCFNHPFDLMLIQRYSDPPQVTEFVMKSENLSEMLERRPESS